jgi:hypothetical protein
MIAAGEQRLLSGIRIIFVVDVEQASDEKQRKNQDTAGIGYETSQESGDGCDQQRTYNQEQRVHLCYITRSS